MEILELFKRQLAQDKGTSSKSTLKNYLSDVRHFISWFERTTQSSFEPNKVTADIILLYEKTLGGYVENSRLTPSSQLSAASIKRHLSSLRKFFTFLRSQSIVSQNPFTQIVPEVTNEPTDLWHLKSFKDSLLMQKASKLTVKNYISDIGGFAKWYEETILPGLEKPLSSTDGFYLINQEILEDYRKRLLEIQNAAPRTVNRKLSALRKYFNFATNQGFITSKELKLDPVKQYEQKMLSSEEPTLALEELPQIPSEKRNYSSIPPVRLAQKLLIFPYLALEEKAANAIASVIAGKPISGIQKLSPKLASELASKNILRAKTNSVSALLGIRNVSKEFYAPDKVSLLGTPLYKRAIYHFKYTRPNWYKRYHSYSFVHYVHFALLVIFASGVGVALYQNLVAKKVSPSFASATAPPRILSFQGRLTDNLDNPITSTSALRFAIYNDASASGGALLWQEAITNIAPDQDGIFSILLGGGTSIPSTVFTDNSQIYLGVTVGTTPELTPRQRIATVGYATNAEFLQGQPPTTQTSPAITSYKNVILALDGTGSFNLNDSVATDHTFQVGNGAFILKGQTLNLTTNLASGGNVILYPDGLGKIDLQKPLINTTNNGNIVPGGVEVNDRFGVLATESAVAAFIVNNNTTGGDILAASSSGTTRFKIANDGTLTDVVYNTAGGLFYGLNTAGTFAQTTAGSPGQCLQSAGGSTPTWGTCGGSSSWWRLNLGAISPINDTLDLLVGASTTASAKFRFINVNSGTPIASVSANSGDNATFLSGNGTLGTTNRQTLTIGNSSSFNTTGNLLINSNGIGKIGIGTTSPLIGFDLRGNSGTTAAASISARTSFATLIVDNAGSGDLFTASSSGVPSFTVKNNGDVIIGSDGLGKLTAGVIDPYLVQNQKTSGTQSLTFQTMGATNADFIFKNTSTTLSTLTQAGQLQLPVTGSTGGIVLGGDTQIFRGAADRIDVAANDSINFLSGTGSLQTNGVTRIDASGNGTFATLTVTSGCSGCTVGAPSPFQALSGAIVPLNGTLDLLVGSQATTSAKFAVLNINGNNTPTASVSATQNNTAAYISGDGSIQSVQNMNFTIGGSTTGNISILPNNGTGGFIKLGSNTTGLELSSAGVLRDIDGTILEINDELQVDGNVIRDSGAATRITLGATTTLTNTALTLSGTTSITASSLNTLTTSASLAVNGPSTITTDQTSLTLFNTTATSISFGGAATTLNLGGAAGVINVGNGGASTITTVSDDNLTLTAQGTGELTLTSDADTGVNIGVSTNTQAPLSVSGGIGSNALAIFNQTNSGDILSASASGTTKFVIKNDGNASSSAGFTIDGTGALQSTKMQTLTIGGSTTGGIVLSPNNGSGSLRLTNFSTNGGLLYTNTAGVVSQTGAGTSAQCLLGGTTPAWGPCATGTTISPFQELSGAIVPFNSTEDFMIGGQATTSAKFAVLNSIGSGTPTASVSSGLNGTAAYFDANGNFRTANKMGLTIGGGNTGNVTIQGNGTLNLVDQNINLNGINPTLSANGSSTLTLNNNSTGNIQFFSSSNTISNTGALTIAGSATINGGTVQLANGSQGTIQTTSNADIVITAGSGTINLNTLSNGPVLTGSGLTTLGGGLTVNGATTTFGNAAPLVTTGVNTDLTITPNGSGNLILTSDFNTGVRIGSSSNTPAVLSVSGGIGSNAGFIVNRVGATDDIFTASAAGVTKFTIANNGNITDTAATAVNFSNATLTVSSCTGCGSVTATNSPFQVLSGSIVPLNSTLDLLVGGQASTSAVLKVTGQGNPFAGTLVGASVSANTSFAALVVDNKGSGDLFAASSSGVPQFVIKNNGAVGIGTTLPAYALHVARTSAGAESQPFFLHNNSSTNGSAVSLSFGAVSGNTITGKIMNTRVAGSNYALSFHNFGASGLFEAARFDLNGSFGIGTTSPNAMLHVNGGNFGANAALIVNQNGVSTNDIFAASASGTTKFVIKNDGNASSSAGFTINGNGNIQSTNSQSLTLGGNTTGNILISPSNGLGMIGIGNVGTTPLLAGLDLRSAQGTLPIASFSGQTSFAGFLVDNKGLGDIFTASTGGVSKFTIKNSGVIQFSNYKVAGGIFYADGSGNLVQTVQGGGTQCLIGGATPSWGTCGSGGGGGNSFWYESSGLIYPANSTEDLAIGGQASASAKFLFANVNSGNPTLKIFNSGMTQSLNLFHDGTNGNITSSTGTVNIGQGGGTLYLETDIKNDTTNFSGFVKVSDKLWVTNSESTGNTLAVFDNLGTGDIISASASGVSKFVVKNDGTASSSAGFTINGIGALQSTNEQTLTIGGATTGNITIQGNGTLSLADTLVKLTGTNPTIGAIGSNTLTLNGNSTGNIQFFSASNTLTNAGALTIAGNATINGTTLQLGNGSAGTIQTTSNQNLTLSAGSGTINLNTVSNGAVTTGTGLTTLGGNLTINGTTETVGNGSNFAVSTVTNGSYTLTAVGSGEIVLNTDADSGVNIGLSTNTIAPLSISGGIGSNATLIVNQQNSGDIFTASASGVTKFTITNAGGISLGGSVGTGQCLTGGTTATWGVCGTPGFSSPFRELSGTIIPLNSTEDFLIGGQASTSAVLKITGQENPFRGTIVGASVSANTSFAGFVIDNKGVGDIFTASSSGVTQLVLRNNGALGLGLAAGSVPTAKLDVNGAASISSALTFRTGAGSIQTTAENPLTIGGNTTGNITIQGNGTLVLADAITSLTGTNPTISATGANTLTLNNNSTGNIQFFSASNTLTSGGALTIAGNATINGTTIQLGNGSAGTIQTTSNQNLTLSAGSGTINLNTVSNGAVTTGTGLTTLGGNLTVNGTTETVGNGSNFAVNTSGNANYTLTALGTGEIVLFTDADSGINIGSVANTPAPLSISGGIGLNAALIVNQLNSGDIFTASASGVTKFSITNGGGISLAGNIGTGQCLTGGTTASWGTCGGGDNFWQYKTATGIVANGNLTTDLLLGGISTTSAKFAVTGIAAGTNPSASVSATTGTNNGNGVVLSGNGTIQSLAKNSLIIGGNTTGNIIFSPQNNIGNGTVGIGPTPTTGIQSSFFVNGDFGGKSLVTFNTTSTNQDIFTASSSGNTKFTISNSGNVDIGTANAPTPLVDPKFQVYSTIGNAPAASISAQNTSLPSLLVTKDGGQNDIFVASYAGIAKFVVDYTGTIYYNGAGGLGTDYAEYFKKSNTDEQFVAGQLICYSDGGATKCKDGNVSQRIIGVISDNALIKGGIAHKDDPNYILVGMVGQLGVWVTGDVKAGDPLTYSSIPGVATTAKDEGNIIGYAKEGNSGIQKRVDSVIQPDYYNPNTALQRDSIFNQLTIALNNGVYGVVDALGNQISHIDAFSKAIIGSLQVGFANIKTLAVDTVTVGGKDLSQFIIDTVRNAGFGTGTVVSPIASDTVKTNVVSPLAENSTVQLNANKNNFEIKNTNNGKTVAWFGDTGNATFSGSLIATGIETENATIGGTLAAGTILSADASVSGTLRAGTIIANNISGLDEKLATLAAAIANSTQASNSGQTNNYLALDTIHANFGIFEQGITSMGPITSNILTATDQLSVGNTFTISNNAINTIGAELQIQSLRQGNIAFEGGLIRMDTDGNMSVNGNFNLLGEIDAVHGVFSGTLTAPALATSLISPLPGDDLTIRLSDSASTSGKLKVTNNLNQEVLSVNSRGDLNASGSGTFAKLNFNLVGKAEATSLSEAIATGSAGFATLRQGQPELTIKNPIITSKSLIYITPFGNTDNKVLYLLRQVPQSEVDDGSFTVGISGQTATHDIQFNWLVVN